jgi:hypothetical protein
MKLYTEDQLKNALYEICISRDIDIFYELESVTPIELPSDDEICDEAESIAHNYFVMQRNHYQGLEEGAKRMAYWLIQKFKQK